MAASMEDRLLRVFEDTQNPAQAPRQQAELHLKQLRNNPNFPTTLATIASHSAIPASLRQAALSSLRQFVDKNWSGEAEEDEGPVIPISEPVKEQVRRVMLELSTSAGDERKVKAGASVVVGKIASVDFPEEWPTLLPTLLQIIPSGSDGQIHGALKVLLDLVEDSLNEDQFFSVARDIVGVVYGVAASHERKPTLRALAVSVFRTCFDIMDMVKDDHGPEVKAFAEEALSSWTPFFLEVMKITLPSREQTSGQREPDSWRDVISLKVQVVKTLMKIRSVFPQLLLPQSTVVFSATWAELSLLQDAFQDLYIDHDEQGRLEDADGLPYTLDFLILEELDFLQSCFRAPPVQFELESQIKASGSIQTTPWVLDVMKLAVAYAQIPNEEEGLWDIDVNLFLAEETSVTANYTARTACGDLIIKLGEWLNQGALEGLLAFTKSLFFDQQSSWRLKEASLFLLTALLNDFLDTDKDVPAQLAAAYLEFIDYALQSQNEYLLRARGFLAAGVMVQTVTDESFPALPLLDRTIAAVTEDESEVVRVACIKAIQGYVAHAPGSVPQDRQVLICSSISAFLEAKDLTELDEADDLLVALVETLKSAINIDPRISIAPGSGVLDLLFLLAKHGAASFQLTLMVNEAFEEIVGALSSMGGDAYAIVCEKVLPSLTGAFDVGNLTEDNPLTTLAAELLATLTEHGSEPLPSGFVAAAMPKLNRLLMSTTEGEILRPGVEAIKYMLRHDHQQMLAWQDNGKSGLEVCLIIIDRLLSPDIEDNSASEVGGLAAELVEQAGAERLGPYLPQLLQAVAARLATAETAPFIQSLVLVFARLSLVGAQDVVEFLTQIQVAGRSGLEVVMSKWLENSVNFAGYDEIRQNVIALSKLYSLNDSRLAQTLVKGDLVIPTSNRIMTRSQAKKTPDQYTAVSAQLKIIKVLIEELLSASGVQNAAAAAAAAEFADEEDDDGWEDVPGTLDLGLNSAKADLMAFGDGHGSFMRQRDDETQAYLTEFFVGAARENTSNFNELYTQLTDGEKAKLTEMAQEGQAAR